jgi:hypothetical protein
MAEEVFHAGNFWTYLPLYCSFCFLFSVYYKGIISTKGAFYIFFNLNVPIIKKDSIIVNNMKNCGGKIGMAKKLSVNKHPAAVIGNPVK